MINQCLAFLIQCLLRLRYRVRIEGMKAIRDGGDRGILFLPNHPALIDPILLTVYLYRPFRARVLADEEQIHRPGIGFLARRARVVSLPSLAGSRTQSADSVRIAMDRCIEALRQQDNLILYPAGRIYRGAQEQIGANSAVERILQTLPDVRVVLVRTSGLWGSRFSWAWGRRPLVIPVLWQGLKALLANGVLFGPRRQVTVELVEARDLPRQGSRREINTYLETFYNQTQSVPPYVPYTWWEGEGARILPEPSPETQGLGDIVVSPVLRRQVIDQLQELAGIEGIKDDMSLTRDLGLDSLAAVELLTWLEAEYGHVNIDVDSLQTVGDVLRAACGEAASLGEQEAYRAPTKWFRKRPWPRRPEGLAGRTITEAFLYQARCHPDRVVVADSLSGAKTYRNTVLAIMLLRREFARLPGPYLGIMLPASVGVTIVYLAVLFSGKIPVMVNWTLGRRHLKHALDSLGVQHIITAQALLTRLQTQGIDLEEILDRFHCLEDLRARFGLWDRLQALFKSYVSWRELTISKPPDTAVVLFTSGSEAVPKAVPLTHRNILTNVSDAYDCLTLTQQDSLLGILPPFHSFGLTVSMILPLSLGLRAFYYPNPTHGGRLGQFIAAYRLTILVGTPTFLHGIVRTTPERNLQPLRLVVSGAEKCPARVYQLLAERCPQVKVLEGYGVTECAPVISVNRQWQVRPGTIGKPLAAVSYAIVDTETERRVALGETGMLLVRGDNVFSGYLQHQGPSPFIHFEDHNWYQTGDLVSEDVEGVLTFRGRRKRFIKLGGEMISLPAIESILGQHFEDPEADGPTLAVVATPREENPDIVLFCVGEIVREDANQVIRNAGLSGLHNVRQVITIDTLPLLGTGKIDYKRLVDRLDQRPEP